MAGGRSTRQVPPRPPSLVPVQPGTLPSAFPWRLSLRLPSCVLALCSFLPPGGVPASTAASAAVGGGDSCVLGTPPLVGHGVAPASGGCVGYSSTQGSRPGGREQVRPGCPWTEVRGRKSPCFVGTVAPSGSDFLVTRHRAPFSLGALHSTLTGTPANSCPNSACHPQPCPQGHRSCPARKAESDCSLFSHVLGSKAVTLPVRMLLESWRWLSHEVAGTGVLPALCTLLTPSSDCWDGGGR